MKKLILPFTLIGLISCGGNKSEDGGISGKTDSTTVVTEVKAAGNQNIIDPAKADLSKPIDVAVLYTSMTCYYNKTVKLIVYPNTYPGKQKWADYLSGSINSTDTKVALQLIFKTVPTGEFTSATPYIVKCKISEIAYDNRLDLNSVELIGELKDAKAEPFSSNSIDSTKLYAVEDVYNSIVSWKDKKVIVTGNYAGSTVSYNSKNKTEILEYRIDMTSGMQGSENAKVGFNFTAKPANEPPAGQSNVTIEGTVTGVLHYGNPYVTNCTIK